MLKVGLIGFGLAGQVFHAPVIRGVPGLELACIVARSGTLAQERYPDVRVVRTVDELLADKDIQLCVVATPNPSHFDLTRQCLLAGRDVVVDKPFAPAMAEAEELVRIAEKQKRWLTVYQNRRWDGDFLTLRKIMEAGALGEISEYEARYDRYRLEIKRNTWREQPEPGGGILFDLGPHVIDQILVLFGPPEGVSARLLFQRGGAVDDGFDVALEYPKFRALARARMVAYAPGPHLLVHGTKGSFSKHGMDTQEELLRNGKTPGGPHWGEEPEANWGTLALVEGGARKVRSEAGDYRQYYANVRDAILKQATLDVTPQQALNTMRALALAQRSHRERRTLGWSESVN